MSDSDWVVADSIYGNIVVNRHDFRGQQILKTGIPPGNASIQRLCAILLDRVGPYGRRQRVIDVGANCGAYAVAMARHALVIAIEPQRELYEALLRTAVDGVNEEARWNVAPLHCAVGHGLRRVATPVIDRTAYHVSDLAKMQPVDVDTPWDRIVIERSIDEIVASHHLDHVDLLKIDTEGMEIDVIEGARETIAKHKPVLFVEFVHCDRFKLQDMLFDLGYPSVQVVDDNDFLCDPDVAYHYQHSYARTDLPSLRSPEELLTMGRLAASVPMGGFVEVGVFKGGSLQRLAYIAHTQDRTCWAFDTFVGVPRVHALDQGIIGDWHGGGDEGHCALMGRMPGVRIIQGEFPDVLQHMTGAAYRDFRGPMVAFAHIDCGTYQSTKASMEALWPKMVSGGVMLMGDYGYQGSKLAADTTGFQLVPKPKISMTEEKRLVLTKP